MFVKLKIMCTSVFPEKNYYTTDKFCPSKASANLLIYQLIYLFIYSFIHLFIYLFIYL